MTQNTRTSPGEPTRDPRLAAIIMAAGKGTRMDSNRPKVVHSVAGRPMVCWVIDTVRAVGASRIALIVGYGADDVRNACAADDRDLEFVVQEQQLGTGHAAQCAGALLGEFDGDILILAGDGPLIRESTVRTLLQRHRSSRAAASLATSVVDDPTGYGRIIRDEHGCFEAIVEERVATDDQRAIREINASYYCFDAQMLFGALREVARNLVSGEWYLTDVPAILQARGETIEVVDAVPPGDVLSINTPAQLAEVDQILLARVEQCL